MAITFSIPSTEIIVTSGQTEVLCQDLINAIRDFEDEFMMMGFDHIADAGGKLPIDVARGIYTEIVLSLRYPWTIRFEDESTAHCAVRGGTLLAFDEFGDPRPVSTNYGLTINQSVSGTLVITGGGGGSWTDPEKAQMRSSLGIDGDKITAVGGQLQSIPGDVWDELLTGSLHNIPLSAGRRLREAQQALVIHEGTAQAGTPVTITLDTAASVLDNYYDNTLVMIVGGTGSGQSRIIRQYTGSTRVALISHRWIITPDDTSEFSIKSGVTHAETDLALHSCYAQGGATDTITLATRASVIDQYYKYAAVLLIGGTGAGQARIITNYVGATRIATIHGDWHTIPDDTTEYQIVDARSVVNVICQDCVDQIVDAVLAETKDKTPFTW